MKEDIKELAEDVIMSTYSRIPIAIEKGFGCRLWDISGKEYIDFVAGIAVCNMGHCHPKVVDALIKQAQKLFHVSNLYYTKPQAKLAAWLTERSFADRVFFCNSGAEANEAAIKLARRFFRERGEKKRFRIISALMSFHGRTMATLSATGQDKIKHGFDPLLEGFDFVPFNDIRAIEKILGPDHCAVLLEPVQGEGGVVCPDPYYLKAVRELCDKTGTLLILDEIQTGLGRTGKLFAHEHFSIKPDIMTLAKALGNGLPIGATLATEKVARGFGPGAHASTFGGTPIITAAALATLRALEEEGAAENAANLGNYFKDRLILLKERYNHLIKDVRGMGLLIGMELDAPAGPISSACMERGFLVNTVQDKILRFIPPLIINKKDIDALTECLDEIFKVFT